MIPSIQALWFTVPIDLKVFHLGDTALWGVGTVYDRCFDEDSYSVEGVWMGCCVFGSKNLGITGFGVEGRP